MRRRSFAADGAVRESAGAAARSLSWRGVYILKIPALGRKVRVFLEWNWAMFFPPDIAHLGYTRTRSGVRDERVEPV